MTDLQGAIDAINPNSTDEEWTRLLAEAMNAADELSALRARVAEMRELLDIAVEDHDSSMGRSNAPLHWTNQARAILSKQEPGRVEVVDEGESGNNAIAAIGGKE